MTGIIFDHKEFAVFDGPGPRQTVFFKGCPLRCSWCHNPEGLCAHPQLMVSNASCAHCGNCIRICTHETCIACGDCVHVCPLHLRSIAGETVTAGELAGRILKNGSPFPAANRLCRPLSWEKSSGSYPGYTAPSRPPVIASLPFFRKSRHCWIM